MIQDAGQPSLVQLTTLLVRRLRLLIALPVLAGLAALGVSLLLPEQYSVEARFMPESGSGDASRLAGLASQFGVNVGGVDSGESVDFYAELLGSRELLRAAVLTEYTISPEGASDSTRATLVELLQVEGETPERRVYAAVQALDELVTARPDPNTEIVTLTTSAPQPELAVQVSRRLIQLVNEFNLDRRQSRAAEEREFLESRVREVEADLRAAEGELEEFLSQNRRYEEWPQLRFQFGRLQRQVDLLQETHTSLSQNLEQARLDEVRNVPVITVLDQPRLPAEQTAPNYLLNVALGVLLGGMLAVGIIVGSEVTKQAKQSHPKAFADLRTATREAVRGRTAPATSRQD